jgi:imidazolonepropionase-like amidohydrolase
MSQRIEGISLWDGTASRGVGSISWTGDRIDAIETAAASDTRSTVSDSAAHTDAGNTTGTSTAKFSIIPGLIDTHVHLGGYAGPANVDWISWPLMTPWEEQVFHIAANAHQAARNGVTTLRDLAGDGRQLAVKRAFDQGIQQGPRILVHGPVGMTAGHGDLFSPPHYPHRTRTADSPDECRKLVREYARAGVDGIKIFTSGGVLSTGDKVEWRNQTTEEIATTLDEAHALGLKVAAHSHTTEGNQIALDAGVDSLEHGTGITEEQWPALLERNISVAPTLMINDVIAEARIPVSDEAQEKAQAVVAERNTNFAAAGRAGVRFVLGTDANGIFVKFGDQMEEVRLMAEMFGWSAERALQSATSDAADAIGMADRVGTLATGLGADFVVLKGRPWEDITQLRTDNIVAVVSRGVVVFGELPQ